MDNHITPIKYENNQLTILDQTKLPNEEIWITLSTKEDVWEAIHELKVRGAPAIGVAAAYGICVALQTEIAEDKLSDKKKISGENKLENVDALYTKFIEIKEYLAGSRPTAVNLFWALDRMNEVFLESLGEPASRIMHDLLSEAEKIQTEDEKACKDMGEYGLELLKPGMGILTHCNAGALATSRYGTCLAPIYLGHERGYDFMVFADETRPLLQGARLTAWELNKAGVDVTLICDNMAATVMRKGLVDAVVVGCDRMAANGDGANKIGTSALAILAKEFDIPFYMFVPTSTIDPSANSGQDIYIEERSGDEISKLWYKKNMAPEGVNTFNPSFDVTDNRYITAVITEKGIVRPPYNFAELHIESSPNQK